MASFPRSVLLLSGLGVSLTSCQATVVIPAEGRISHITPRAGNALTPSPTNASEAARGPAPRTTEAEASGSFGSPLVPIGLPVASQPTTSGAAKNGSDCSPLVGRVSTYDSRLDLAAIKAFGAEPVISAMSFDVSTDRKGNTYFGLMVQMDAAHGGGLARMFVKVTPTGKNLYYTPGEGWTASLSHTFPPGYHGDMVADGDGRLYYTYYPRAEATDLYRLSADGLTVDVFKSSSPLDHLTVDAKGTVYFPDRDRNAIVRLTPTGKMETIAGGGSQGDRDGKGAAATFNRPNHVVVEPNGNLIVSEISMERGKAYHLRRVTQSGDVTTLPFQIRENDELKPAHVNVFGLAMDTRGTIYVSDGTADVIYRGTEQNGAVVLEQWAGSPNEKGYVDGAGKKARFKLQSDLVMADCDRLLVIDDGNQVVRQIQ